MLIAIAIMVAVLIALIIATHIVNKVNEKRYLNNRKAQQQEESDIQESQED